MRSIGNLALALLLAGSAGSLPAASFADGPRPSPAPDVYAYTPAPTQLFYDWSGFYFGGHIGMAATKGVRTLNASVLGTSVQEQLSANSSDFFGGGQLGYQKQFRDFVAGVELSYSAVGAELSTSSTFALPGLNVTTEVKDLLLVSGKLGYAYMNYLAYLKGGYATAAVSTSSNGLFSSSASGRGTGWVGGVGVNYAVHPSIILGVEYNYIRLNSDSQALAGSPVPAAVSGSGLDMQNVMLRLDFKFGGGQH